MRSRSLQKPWGGWSFDRQGQREQTVLRGALGVLNGERERGPVTRWQGQKHSKAQDKGPEKAGHQGLGLLPMEEVPLDRMEHSAWV